MVKVVGIWSNIKSSLQEGNRRVDDSLKELGEELSYVEAGDHLYGAALQNLENSTTLYSDAAQEIADAWIKRAQAREEIAKKDREIIDYLRAQKGLREENNQLYQNNIKLREQLAALEAQQQRDQREQKYEKPPAEGAPKTPSVSEAHTKRRYMCGTSCESNPWCRVFKYLSIIGAGTLYFAFVAAL